MNHNSTIITRVRALFNTDLIKVSFLNGIATLIRMLTGFISIKVVASIIGPTGIALLGQLNNFATILLTIANGGITAGVTKYVSENNEAPEKQEAFLSAGFRITLVLSIVLSIFLFVSSGYLSVSILHNPDFRLVFWFFGATILIQALCTYLVSVVNGFKEYRIYVWINIGGSVIGLLFSILLAVNFGIMGALIAAVTFQAAHFLLILYLLHKRPWFSLKHFTQRFDKKSALQLGQYTLMALASAITIPAGQLIVRNMIAGQYGLANAGLWEGVNRISNMYLTVITVSLGVYYLPRLAELKTKTAIRSEVFKVYKLIIPFLLLSATGIYLFRELIIHILFTQEFSGMKDLFFYQLIGDILKTTGWVLGYLLIAKAMTRIYITMELVNFALLFLFSYLLVPVYGAKGATIAYAGIYAVYLIVLLFVFRKTLFSKLPDQP